jgi:putative PIG3 family NAD(P)H quinone oxidoreductase
LIAIDITTPGGPDVLRAVDLPVPEPGPGDVLVRIHAAGVNRPDIHQRLGRYPPPPGASPIPGLELAGEVVQVGARPTDEPGRWAPGDPVCALVAGGAYAEYAVAPAGQCLPVPSGFDMVRAAALPETYFTVWTNLFQRGQLQAGHSVLVHGGSSGIGTTAIQLARAFGATVYTTAGSDDKCRACERLGAHAAINYRTADFVERIGALTAGRGVDIVLDMVGASYFERNLRALADDGRLLQIGLLEGARTEVNLSTIMRRRLTITGSTLRIRTADVKAAIARELEQHVWPLLSSGAVGPIVHAVFPLAEAAEAHRTLEAGNAIGKIVLTTAALRT